MTTGAQRRRPPEIASSAFANLYGAIRLHAAGDEEPAVLIAHPDSLAEGAGLLRNAGCADLNAMIIENNADIAAGFHKTRIVDAGERDHFARQKRSPRHFANQPLAREKLHCRVSLVHRKRFFFQHLVGDHIAGVDNSFGRWRRAIVRARNGRLCRQESKREIKAIKDTAHRMPLEITPAMSSAA